MAKVPIKRDKDRQSVTYRNIRQSSKSKGIKLPNNVEVKLSQFADDMTLICTDTESLKENMSPSTGKCTLTLFSLMS